MSDDLLNGLEKDAKSRWTMKICETQYGTLLVEPYVATYETILWVIAESNEQVRHVWFRKYKVPPSSESYRSLVDEYLSRFSPERRFMESLGMKCENYFTYRYGDFGITEKTEPFGDYPLRMFRTLDSKSWTPFCSILDALRFFGKSRFEELPSKARDYIIRRES